MEISRGFFLDCSSRCITKKTARKGTVFTYLEYEEDNYLLSNIKTKIIIYM